MNLKQRVESGEIKRCPFCGSENLSIPLFDTGSKVYCHGCGAIGPKAIEGIDGDSITAWNQRVIHTNPNEEGFPKVTLIQSRHPFCFGDAVKLKYFRNPKDVSGLIHESIEWHNHGMMTNRNWFLAFDIMERDGWLASKLGYVWEPCVGRIKTDK